MEDKLIIYYSGHGYLHKGRGYWLPYDAEVKRLATYLRNSSIKELIGDILAKHILLISDSCFSGTLTRHVDLHREGLEEFERDPSRWVISSGRQEEEVADGQPGANSPFTASILKVLLKNEAAGLNAGLFYDQVSKLTRFQYEQMPQSGPIVGAGHEGGQYVFRLKDKGQVDQEAENWEKLKHSKDISGLLVFLKDHPNSKYEKQARALINKYEQRQVDATRARLREAAGRSTFTDPRDGQSYKTVEINGLVWMAENLNYDVVDGCWFYGEDPKNEKPYGRLYSWEAAKNACPPGWRLPTDEEWRSMALGMGGYFTN